MGSANVEIDGDTTPQADNVKPQRSNQREENRIGAEAILCLLKSPFPLIPLILLATKTYDSRPSCLSSSRFC
jgi:hypothetical protein